MVFNRSGKAGREKSTFSVRKLIIGATLALLPLSSVLLLNQKDAFLTSAEDAISLPSEEESLDGTGLSVNITSSTSTDISQAFTMTMTSSATTGYNNGARRNNVYVVIDDDSYDPEATIAEGEELPTYEASVYWIDFRGNATSIYIPRQVTYKGHFVLNVTSISSTVCYSEAIIKGNAHPEGSEDDYGYGSTKATQIFIPSNINTIEEGAFPYFPSTISLAFEGETLPEDCQEGWTDCPEGRMLFSQSAKDSDLDVSVSSRMDFGKSEGYIIGYYNENEYYAPLLVSYDVVDEDGKLIEEGRIHQMELMSSINPYDAIGGSVGSKTVTLNVDLDMAKGEYADTSSIVIHNIYSPVQITTEEGYITFVPDLTQAYSIQAKLGHNVRHLEIGDFFSVSAKRVSTFMGHLEVDIDLLPKDDYYQTVNPTVYSLYINEINSGAYYPRILLYNLRLAEYQVTYKANDGNIVEVKGRVGTPIDYVLLENGKVNTVGFMISEDWVNKLYGEDGASFNYDSLVSINISGFSVKTDLWINGSGSSLNKSDTINRFGPLSLLPNGKAGSAYINLASVLLISFASYLGLALLIAVGYFLYAKRKYRNDEFRRVNDKRYWIAASKNIVGFGIVFLAIDFIVMRFGIMITTVVSYNPLDTFVVVFSVAGLIFIGLAIRSAYISIKNSMKRKKDAKLHIDQDKAEDGTN